MTIDELNEEFDNKCALVMSEYMRGKLQFEEYDAEMYRLGEWYDARLEEIEKETK